MLAVFAGLAFAFSLNQSIWIDETTQLSGLTLPFAAQLEWLAGGENPIPGVPPDRMPPLSYWLGALWAEIFGLSEMSMRVFGIVAMLSGAPAIFLAARDIGGERARGLLPGIVLAIVYLAPGTIVQAGEIRAYPLYFAFAAWAILAFLRALQHPHATAWLWWLGAFCVAAAYTHYFGVVMASLLWLSLLIVRWARRDAVRPVTIGGGAAALLLAGLLPFIFAAMDATGTGADAPSLAAVLKDTARLVVRLSLHGVHLSSPLVTGAALISTVTLGVLAVASVRRSGAVGIGLLLPMVLAFAMLPLFSLAIGGFDVLAPHYNLWLVPLFTLFAATAIADRRLHNPALGAAVVLIAGHLVADWRLMSHAKAYSHGPGEWITAAITDPEETVLVYDGSGNWAHAYFPVYYLTKGQVTQVVRDERDRNDVITPSGPQPFEGSINDFATQIFIRTRSLDSSALARLLEEPGDCGIPAMGSETDANGETSSFCAFVGATMEIRR